MFDLMAFTPPNASSLTGLSERRLRDWRRAGVLGPRYGEEFREPNDGPSHFYAVRDVVGLRALALLREQGVSLQDLRAVQPWLVRHRDTPWEDLRLLVTGHKLCLIPPAPGTSSECNRERSTFVIELRDVVEDLRLQIKRLQQRQPEEIGQITRTRGVLGGKWRIAGTRIPPSAVWNFHEDGYDTDEIIEQYPSLTPDDVRAAIAHEGRVREERRATRRAA